MPSITPIPESDIISEQDIVLLVKAFEEKGRLQNLLPPSVEKEIAHNQELMLRFWQSVLLEASPFLRHPLASYAFLHLPTTHIGRWIHLFYQVLEENFKGRKAEVAKASASILARHTSLHFQLPA
ncbi:globin family protein [Rufibacter soli]